MIWNCREFYLMTVYISLASVVTGKMLDSKISLNDVQEINCNSEMPKDEVNVLKSMIRHMFIENAIT